MSFSQLKRIKEVDQTIDQAIASYGSFVSYSEGLASRVSKSSRRGWSPDRVSLSKCRNTVGAFHQAIADKFGMQGVHKAVTAHPFS